jgi:transcriptional regulator with XRE-family HTH domain
MPASLSEYVASEIRAEKARRKFTVRSLATAAGLSTMTLQRRLTGEVPFDLVQLEAVAAAFGLSPLYFVVDYLSIPADAITHHPRT